MTLEDSTSTMEGVGRSAYGEETARPHGAPRTWILWLIGLLSLAALGVSLYLSWQSLAGAIVAGCNPGAGCDKVLSSQWRSWLGIPASLLGATLYLVILVAIGLVRTRSHGTRHKLGTDVLAASAVMAGGAAIWFIGLQAVVLKEFCAYCTAVHVCSLLLTVLVFVGLPGTLGVRRASLRCAMAVGAIGLVMLIGGQVLFPAATFRITDRGGDADYDSGLGTNRRVRLAGSSVEIAPHQLPIVGSPDAQCVIVSFFSYTCWVCRLEHQFMKQAQMRYGDELAVVVLPVGCGPAAPHNHEPMSVDHADHSHGEESVEKCAYASLAIAVWQADPEHFVEFHDWLMTDAAPMFRRKQDGAVQSLDNARAYAATLVGPTALEQALEQNPQALAQKWHDWRLTLGDHGTTVPVLSVGKQVVSGHFLTALDLFHTLEQLLGIQHPQADSRSSGAHQAASDK